MDATDDRTEQGSIEDYGSPTTKWPDVLVNVLEDPSSPDGLTIDWRFDGGTPQGNTPIVLKRKTGPYTMKFSLLAPGLKFKSPAEDAMWVRRGTSHCPRRRGNGGHITFLSRSDQLLVVENDNEGGAVNLRYMLRFDPDPRVLDPIIRNGGSYFVDPTTVAFILGAAALTALGLYSHHRHR